MDRLGLSFDCENDRLYGVLDRPANGGATGLGVLILVGGPQYRIGSHRQFALLARSFAERGVPAMRFDYRGMGDSEGEPRGFEHVGADIRAAVDCFVEQCPDVTRIVLWGLCDAVPAALFYAPGDSRIAGLVLLNPWVRTDSGLARTYVKRYYTRRLFEGSFWRKLFRGELPVRRALGGFFSVLSKARSRGGAPDQPGAATASLPERMREAMGRYDGPCLFVLSGDDLTAGEFKDLVAADRAWQKLLAGDAVTVEHLPEANHTFSRRSWRDRVATLSIDWVLAR